jgi:hypothetical protein
MSTRCSSILLLAALFALGCGSLEASAAKDPMKCERDPKCKNKSRAADCSVQCADDPECVRRCEEVQRSTGASQR